MTGFGKAQGYSGQIGFRVEISTINRKQMDLKFSLPQEIAGYEAMLRQMLSKRVSRGAITFRVSFLEGMAPEPVCTLDTHLARRLIRAVENLAEELDQPRTISIADLLNVPGVIRIESADCAGDDVEVLLRQVAGEAIQNLVDARKSEGNQLAQDISARLEILRSTLEKIISLATNLPRQQFEKLQMRLNEWKLSVKPDDERLLREMVLFADKLDVTEEITRLKSHFGHFQALVEMQTDAVGRQLDFMVQEIFREINTLGNKAAGVEVSPLVVVMKTELEKIREQVQNIE